MPIEPQELQTWIGTEALDASGEKLGKIEDVYYLDADPVLVGIRSGLAGRKHGVAVLDGASVTRDSVQLACGPDAVVKTDGGPPTGEQLSRLGSQDDRLRDLAPDRLESFNAREERLKAEAEARARADELDEEARLRAKDEEDAVARAREAEAQAEKARREREDIEAEARAARREAG